MLYSFVVRDIENELVLPIAEFHTTSHSSVNIEEYLHRINHLIESNSSSSLSILPRIIVVDFSWASIHAILSQFNKCQISHYLNLCYKLLVEKEIKEFSLPVKVNRKFLYSFHFNKISDLN